MSQPTYTVTHSEWSDDPYGWQVRDLDGHVIDVYEERAMAEAYAEYMNDRRAVAEYVDRTSDALGHSSQLRHARQQHFNL